MVEEFKRGGRLRTKAPQVEEGRLLSQMLTTQGIWGCGKGNSAAASRQGCRCKKGKNFCGLQGSNLRSFEPAP